MSEGPLPDRRKHGYVELEEKLDTHAHRLEARFERWLKLGLIAFTIMAMTSVVSLVGFGIILKQQHNEIIERCVNQNHRHDNAISALIQGSNEDQLNNKDTVAREEIQRRRDVTIALLDNLAPKTNCEDPKPVKLLPQVTPIEEAP
jgi:hypothetical protein